jgi:hypothetical protein
MLDNILPTNTVFVLGASDPEMERISAWLHHAQAIVLMAGNRSKRWVNPSEAYNTSTLIGTIPRSIRVSNHVLVECDGPACQKLPGKRVVVDHHAEGHPGYGQEPRDYWRASSLGQLARLFGYGLDCVPYPVFYRLGKGSSPWPLPPFAANVAACVAAADHCLRAAYAGQCPGVTPEALFEFRLAEKARHRKVSTLEIERQIHEAIIALTGAPDIELAPGVTIKDMRENPVAELPEASAIMQIGFLGRMKMANRTKYTCMGDQGQVSAFMRVWAPSQGLVDIYGDPVRGYAGAFEETTP